MTEENLSAGLDAQQQAAPTQEHTAPVDTGVSQDAPNVDLSGYVPKDRVNELVVSAKAKAYEKGLAEARGNTPEVSREASQQPAFDESKIDSMLTQKLEGLREQERQRVQQEKMKAEVDVICNKLQESATEFSKHTPDYKDALERVNNFAGAEAILEVASGLDNPAEVIYHLANNPRDIPNLNSICHSYRGAGIAELKKISDRLKQNSNAKNSPLSPSPLSQVSTESRDGMGETGNSFAYFRNKYTV